MRSTWTYHDDHAPAVAQTMQSVIIHTRKVAQEHALLALCPYNAQKKRKNSAKMHCSGSIKLPTSYSIAMTTNRVFQLPQLRCKNSEVRNVLGHVIRNVGTSVIIGWCVF